jgi:SM-20-related protein
MKNLEPVRLALGTARATVARIAGRRPPIAPDRTSDACAIDDVALNPALDRTQLAETFQRQGRIQVRDVLTEAAARRLLQALEQEIPWGLIFNTDKGTAEVKSVSDEKHQQIILAAWKRAHTRFQYVHHHYRLSERDKIYPAPDHYLGRLIAFLRSPVMLEFVRQVTGMPVQGLQSATATLFKPLHFLTAHDDQDMDSRRLVAFALNLTPEWRPDWGGALQFYDRNDHIEEGYLPLFNALNLFRVPKLHSVSQVSSFGGLRYSVVGWFETGAPA